jgi:hypothetical protein
MEIVVVCELIGVYILIGTGRFIIFFVLQSEVLPQSDFCLLLVRFKIELLYSCTLFYNMYIEKCTRDVN